MTAYTIYERAVPHHNTPPEDGRINLGIRDANKEAVST